MMVACLVLLSQWQAGMRAGSLAWVTPALIGLGVISVLLMAKGARVGPLLAALLGMAYLGEVLSLVPRSGLTHVSPFLVWCVLLIASGIWLLWKAAEPPVRRRRIYERYARR